MKRMIIKVHFFFKGVDQEDLELTLEESCRGDVEKLKAAFGECNIAINMCSGLSKLKKPFLKVSATPAAEGKYEFKLRPLEYFWFIGMEWIGILSCLTGAPIQLDYQGHVLKMEKIDDRSVY